MPRVLAFFFAVLASSVVAGPYDGLYAPSGFNWNCKDIGMDGGALAMKDDEFFGVENTCKLSNPVGVRGMSATLFDANCSGEGETSSYRMMFLRTGTDLTVIANGYALLLERCP
jgi:hypothetical protein